MCDAVLKGQCLCGAVTVTVDGAHDPRPGVCHCRMCQRWSGGVFLCFEAAAGAVCVTGPVARFASSDFAERAFCAACGSHLWMRDTDADDADQAAYELMPGLFDEARDWALRSEIYVDNAIVPLPGDHPRATAAQYKAKNKTVEEDA
ncbi:MAG: GFA family protein [Pseudomonadota bacterium]